VGAFQTPNDPLGNARMMVVSWQSVVWKKRTGPFSLGKNKKMLRCMVVEGTKYVQSALLSLRTLGNALDSADFRV